MKQLRTAVKNLKIKREELYEKFERTKRQKEDMENKYEAVADQIKQKAEYKNALLDDKLEQSRDELTRKEIQLHEIIQKSGINNDNGICEKMKESIEAKNQLLR